MTATDAERPAYVLSVDEVVAVAVAFVITYVLPTPGPATAASAPPATAGRA